jgi:polyphosphate kinase
MERNLDRRVEVLCPVIDGKLADHLRSVVLHAYLNDTHRGRLLTATGAYVPDVAATDESLSSQEVLLSGYTAEAKAE